MQVYILLLLSLAEFNNVHTIKYEKLVVVKNDAESFIKTFICAVAAFELPVLKKEMRVTSKLYFKLNC